MRAIPEAPHRNARDGGMREGGAVDRGERDDLLVLVPRVRIELGDADWQTELRKLVELRLDVARVGA